jgi:hypothetical protein
MSEARETKDETAAGPMIGAELDRARLAYRGALEAARAWRGFSNNPRHHDMSYWSLLSSLFAEPGMNRMTLLERIMEYAGVSRSTAERVIREARDCGFIEDQPAGKEVHYFLSEATSRHCIDYFRRYMDQAQMMRTLGYG